VDVELLEEEVDFVVVDERVDVDEVRVDVEVLLLLVLVGRHCQCQSFSLVQVPSAQTYRRIQDLAAAERDKLVYAPLDLSS
jgi:hypothetical protein